MKMSTYELNKVHTGYDYELCRTNMYMHMLTWAQDTSTKKKILKKYTRNSNDKTRSVMSDTVSNTTGSVNAS